MCSLFKLFLFSVFIILNVIITVAFSSKRNNVCTTYEAYNYIDESPDCYYDPDVDSDDPEKILLNHVDRFEKYKMTTDDGYILTVYRIPKKNPKGVILLVHPLIADALTWIAAGNSSIAYMLSNAGYDIWLPSYRGTLISNQHIHLRNDSVKYSDYSFHELAVHDTKIWVDFIKNKTKRCDLVYIGHSMSSTVGIVYSAIYPKEAAESFKVVIPMAPGYTFNHIYEPALILLTNSSRSLERIIRNLTYEMAIGTVHTSPVLKLFKQLTTVYPFNWIFSIVACLQTGWTPAEANPIYLPMIVRRIPRGFSMKSYYHFWQIINSGKFMYFDYGKEENLRRYSQKEPPLYPIEDIRVPIYLVYTADDSLCTAEDIEELYERLPKEARIYGKYKISGLNHLDFHIGKHREEKVYTPLVKFIDSLFT